MLQSEQKKLFVALISKCHGTPVLTVSHIWKQAFSLQTNVGMVDTKMAAESDHYLEVIKLPRLSVACQRLSNYVVNWWELFMRHNIIW